jgi:hypothetical protein
MALMFLFNFHKECINHMALMFLFNIPFLPAGAASIAYSKPHSLDVLVKRSILA